MTLTNNNNKSIRMLYKLNNVNKYGNISLMYHWCARYIVRFLVTFPHIERANG